MGGGQVAIRGYIVQALIGLLDALTDDHEWIAVTLEPNHASEKIDILWQYPRKSRGGPVVSRCSCFRVRQVWSRKGGSFLGHLITATVMIHTPEGQISI